MYRAFFILMGLTLATIPPPPAVAEEAWVAGKVRINIRRGAGTDYKIIGSLNSEDPVEIVGREGDWTQVRSASGKTGYVPSGYLRREPPASVKVSSLESEVARLRERLGTSESRTSKLTDENRSLASRDADQRSEIERLATENSRLRDNARWREWLTGAGILATGMILGAMLHRSSNRKKSNRLRF